jgi:Bacterial capsule synthesis protein PGA_cap
MKLAMKFLGVKLSMRNMSAALLIALIGLAFQPRTLNGQTSEVVQQATTENSQETLRCSVTDGFTLAAVGDLIVAQPISTMKDDDFAATSRILRDADVAFGNMEATLIDIRHFKGYPQASNDGDYGLIGVPEVARDLRAMGIRLVSRANNHATDHRGRIGP